MTCPTLNAILQLRRAGCACAVNTTEDLSVRFDAVADDTTVAVGANGRKHVNCALEAIENVTFPTHDHFERLVIIVLANFVSRHTTIRSRENRCLAVSDFDNRAKFSVRTCNAGPLINTSL